MLHNHEAPWRAHATFGQRTWSDLQDLAAKGPWGWSQIVFFLLLPCVLPFMVWGLIVEIEAPIGLLVSGLWFLIFGAEWFTTFALMLRPGPVVRRLILATVAVSFASLLVAGLGSLGLAALLLVTEGTVEIAWFTMGVVWLLFSGVKVHGLRSSWRRRGVPAPGPVAPASYPRPGGQASHVLLQMPTGEARTTVIGPMQPAVVVASAQSSAVASRVASLLGDPGGRLVVPPEVPTSPGHLLVTETAPSGQICFLVPLAAQPAATMWQHARPTLDAQETR